MRKTPIGLAVDPGAGGTAVAEPDVGFQDMPPSPALA